MPRNAYSHFSATRVVVVVVIAIALFKNEKGNEKKIKYRALRYMGQKLCSPLKLINVVVSANKKRFFNTK
jgi:hypothetical protein